MEFSDQKLVSEIRSGSGVAFERLMGRYGKLVYRVAYGFTGNGESAMEVAQDTFLKIHERLGSWREEGVLRNWIARIAANEALNRVRVERRHPTQGLDEDGFPSPGSPQEEWLRARETRDALRRSMSFLNRRQRTAVVLRYYQGMSIPEIAAVLGCSEGTARNMLCRGLRKLRSVMAGFEEAAR